MRTVLQRLKRLVTVANALRREQVASATVTSLTSPELGVRIEPVGQSGQFHETSVRWMGGLARSKAKELIPESFFDEPKDDVQRAKEKRRLEREKALERHRFAHSLRSKFRKFISKEPPPHSWRERCAQIALELVDILNCKQIMAIYLYSGLSGYINNELFEAVAQRTLNAGIIEGLRINERGVFVIALGSLYHHGARFDAFEQLARLLIGGVKVNVFASEEQIPSVIYNIGIIFNRDGGLEVDEKVWECVRCIVNRQFKPMVASAWSGGLVQTFQGFANLGYDNSRVLNAVCDEIDTRLTRTFDDKKPYLRHDEISSIVWALGMLEHYHADVLYALSVQIEKRVSTFKENDLANIVWGCSRIRYTNARLWNALGVQLSEESRAIHYSTNDLGKIMHGLGHIGYKNGNVLEVLSQEIRLPNRLRQFSNENLLDIFYTVGKFGWRNEELMSALCMEVTKEHRMDKLEPKHLANVLWAIGLLDYRDATLLKCITDKLCNADVLKTLAKRELLKVVDGLGRVGCEDEHALKTLSQEVLEPARMVDYVGHEIANILHAFCLLKYNDVDCLNAFSEELAKPRRVRKFKSEDIVDTLYGLGFLGCKDVEVAHKICNLVTKNGRLTKLGALELSKTVNGMGMIGHYDARHMQLMLGRALVIMNESQIDWDNVVNLVVSLVTLGDKMDLDLKLSALEPFLSALGGKICEGGHGEIMEPPKISKLCISLANLQFLDADAMAALVDRFMEQCKEPSNVTPSCILRVFHACALLNHRHEAFLAFLDNWINSNLQKVKKARHIANLVWGLSVVDKMEVGLFEECCLMLKNMNDAVENLDARELRYLLHASEYLTRKPGTSELNNVALELINEVRDKCASNSDYKLESINEEVCETLELLGLDFEEQKTMAGGLVADIFVRAEVGSWVEVDGPSQYTINKVNGKFVPMGDNVLRQKLLERCAYKVMHIPYFEWNSMDMENRKAFLCDQLGCTYEAQELSQFEGVSEDCQGVK